VYYERIIIIICFCVEDEFKILGSVHFLFGVMLDEMDFTNLYIANRKLFRLQHSETFTYWAYLEGMSPAISNQENIIGRFGKSKR
jgi:hypothetical protein